MKTTLIYIIAVLVVVGVAGGAVFLLLNSSSGAPTPVDTGSTGGTYTGGTSGTTQVNTGTSTTSSGTLTVAATLGSPIVVKDFTKDPKTVTTSTIPDHYFISGGVDAYSNDSAYSTYYVGKDQSFTIVLLTEPISETRKATEQQLMKELGISSYNMCRLRYYLSVPRDVNELYAGKGNLGFSFCPGATQL